MQQIIAHLPREIQITDVDVLGYSLGGANAAVVKSIDAAEGKLKVHRAVMINPPVSLFESVTRLDKLFAINIGSGDAGVENLYRRLYTRLANLYRNSDKVRIDESDLLSAAAAVLKTDADFSAAIALSLPETCTPVAVSSLIQDLRHAAEIHSKKPRVSYAASHFRNISPRYSRLTTWPAGPIRRRNHYGPTTDSTSSATLCAATLITMRRPIAMISFWTSLSLRG
jgi:pimeloyl-ACP methyl ester carboxylesterase